MGRGPQVWLPGHVAVRLLPKKYTVQDLSAKNLGLASSRISLLSNVSPFRSKAV